MGRTSPWVAVVGAVALLTGSGCIGTVGLGGVQTVPTAAGSPPIAAPAPTTDQAAPTTTLTTAAPVPHDATAGTGVDPGGPGTHGGAVATLGTLQVREAEPGGYDRDLFGLRWSDDVAVAGGHNGCDTRNDILRRDLVSATAKPGTQECVIAAGTLHDPYTGEIVDFVRGPDSDRVQIDHVVALSDAWSKGARWLTPEQRTDFANDPLNLLAVGGAVNQSKGNGDAADWLPPARSGHCAYVARQIAVKDRYRLWITVDEFSAMTLVLATCPDQTLPQG